MKRLDLSGRATVGSVAVPFEELATQPTARGVVLTPDVAFESLAPYLPQLDLVVVTFPIFRDGRGFTQARALREYGGFTGEIRATGHLLPDQANHLRRVGIDSVELPDDADPSPWERGRHRFHTAYQFSVGGESGPLSGLRRALT